MIIFIFILFFIVFIFSVFVPKIDFYTDYRGKEHIVLWYSWGTKRKYLILYEEI